MSLTDKIKSAVKTTAFGICIYTLSALSGFSTNANASINVPNLSESYSVSQSISGDQSSFTYQVKSGDTLSRISSQFKNMGYTLSIEDIAAQNNISNLDLIEEGQVLSINFPQSESYKPKSKNPNDSNKEKLDVNSLETKIVSSGTSLSPNLSKTTPPIGDYNLSLVERPTSIADVDYNRDQVSKVSGDDIKELRLKYGVKGLERMLDLEKGISVHTNEEIINALALVEPYLEKYLSGSKLKKEVLQGILLSEGGDNWRISNSGALGAWQLVGSIYCPTPNMALHSFGSINPFDLEQSTKRVVELFTYLHKRYRGNYELAKLAFHDGEGKVDNLINSAKELFGENFTFQQLSSLNLDLESNQYNSKVARNIKVAKKLVKQVAEQVALNGTRAQFIESLEELFPSSDEDVPNYLKEMRVSVDKFNPSAVLKPVIKGNSPNLFEDNLEGLESFDKDHFDGKLINELNFKSTPYGQMSEKLVNRLNSKHLNNQFSELSLVTLRDEKFDLEVVPNNLGDGSTDKLKEGNKKPIFAKGPSFIESNPEYMGKGSVRLLARLREKGKY